MRTEALVVFSLCLLAAGYRLSVADEGGEDKLRKEHALFEGTWKFASMEFDGKAVPAEQFKDSRLICKGGHFTSVTRGTFHGTYKLDVDKKPKQIDVTMTDGPLKGQVFQGIYELDAETYKVCMGYPGKGRPTEFASKEGSGHGLQVLKRQKDDAVGAERKRLEGTWQAVSYERDGKKTPAEDLKTVLLIVDADGKAAVQNDGKTLLAGATKIDPAAKPKAIDITFTEGDAVGKTALGIYEIDGDGLTLCRAAPGKDRPTEFTAKAGSGLALMVYRRANK